MEAHGDKKIGFARALREIAPQLSIHGALAKAMSALYGYASDADGIRHSLKDETEADQASARFLLVTCSSFTSLVVERTLKARPSG